MVRFIILSADAKKKLFGDIYIPIWLDLLFRNRSVCVELVEYLHSNMVRFIIQAMRHSNIQYRYLHSNMVRFIIDYFTTSLPNPTLFTFQYG